MPAEEAIGSWENESEAEEGLAGLVGSVTKLVLVKLGGLNEIAIVRTLLCVQINLDLTTAAAAAGLVGHVGVELHQGVVVRLGSNIQHEHVFRLDPLTDALKEPLVRVDFSIIPVLNSEHEVDPVNRQLLVLKSKIQ